MVMKDAERLHPDAVHSELCLADGENEMSCEQIPGRPEMELLLWVMSRQTPEKQRETLSRLRSVVQEKTNNRKHA